MGRGRFVVRMVFGGAAAPYALAVHEHPSPSDPPSWKAAGSVTFGPGNRGPKYLESPYLEMKDSIVQDIIDNVVREARKK